MTTNLAKLTGSDKQIEWATDLRAKMIENAKEYMNILTIESDALAQYGMGKKYFEAVSQIDTDRQVQLESCFCQIVSDIFEQPEDFEAAIDSVLENQDSAKFYINLREYINI